MQIPTKYIEKVSTEDPDNSSPRTRQRKWEEADKAAEVA